MWAESHEWDWSLLAFVTVNKTKFLLYWKKPRWKQHKDGDINRPCSWLFFLEKERKKRNWEDAAAIREQFHEQMAHLWWNGSSVDAAHLWVSWSGVHGSLKILAVSTKVLAQKFWGIEGKQRAAGSTQDNCFFLDSKLLPRVWYVYKKISLPASGNESRRETYSGLQ